MRGWCKEVPVALEIKKNLKPQVDDESLASSRPRSESPLNNLVSSACTVNTNSPVTTINRSSQTSKNHDLDECHNQTNGSTMTREDKEAGVLINMASFSYASSSSMRDSSNSWLGSMTPHSSKSIRIMKQRKNSKGKPFYSSSNKRVVTPEVKLEAIECVLIYGQTKASVARTYNIPESTLRGWCKEVPVALEIKKNLKPQVDDESLASSSPRSESPLNNLVSSACTVNTNSPVTTINRSSQTSKNHDLDECHNQTNGSTMTREDKEAGVLINMASFSYASSSSMRDSSNSWLGSMTPHSSKSIRIMKQRKNSKGKPFYSSSNKRVVTPEVKLEAIECVLIYGQTKASVARTYNIPESTLRGWCKEVPVALEIKKNLKPQVDDECLASSSPRSESPLNNLVSSARTVNTNSPVTTINLSSQTCKKHDLDECHNQTYGSTMTREDKEAGVLINMAGPSYASSSSVRDSSNSSLGSMTPRTSKSIRIMKQRKKSKGKPFYSSSNKRVVTPEVKLEAIECVLIYGQTKASVARTYNIPESTLRGWCKEVPVALEIKKNLKPQVDDESLASSSPRSESPLNNLVSSACTVNTNSPVTTINRSSQTSKNHDLDECHNQTYGSTMTREDKEAGVLINMASFSYASSSSMRDSSNSWLGSMTPHSSKSIRIMKQRKKSKGKPFYSSSNKRVVTPEVKLEAIECVLIYGQTKASVARTYNIPESTLRGWCKEVPVALEIKKNLKPQVDDECLASSSPRSESPLNNLVSSARTVNTNSPVTTINLSSQTCKKHDLDECHNQTYGSTMTREDKEAGVLINMAGPSYASSSSVRDSSNSSLGSMTPRTSKSIRIMKQRKKSKGKPFYSSSNKRVVTPEVKLEAIECVLIYGQTKASVARTYNIPESTLRGWCKEVPVALEIKKNLKPQVDDECLASSSPRSESPLNNLVSSACTVNTNSPVTTINLSSQTSKNHDLDECHNQTNGSTTTIEDKEAGVMKGEEFMKFLEGYTGPLVTQFQIKILRSMMENLKVNLKVTDDAINKQLT
uniref:HTH psq-type domain-containing protein n=1 Tax=Trichogramma kaykai TaxID=54128 RepID=A0ABD2XAU7_9HYME